MILIPWHLAVHYYLSGLQSVSMDSEAEAMRRYKILPVRFCHTLKDAPFYPHAHIHDTRTHRPVEGVADT